MKRGKLMWVNVTIFTWSSSFINMQNRFKRCIRTFEVFIIFLVSSCSGMHSVFPNSRTSCAFCSGKRRIMSGRSCGATPWHETRWKKLWRTSVRLAETSCFLYLRNKRKGEGNVLRTLVRSLLLFESKECVEEPSVLLWWRTWEGFKWKGNGVRERERGIACVKAWLMSMRGVWRYAGRNAAVVAVDPVVAQSLSSVSDRSLVCGECMYQCILKSIWTFNWGKKDYFNVCIDIPPFSDVILVRYWRTLVYIGYLL